jgi:hypothetical protein
MRSRTSQARPRAAEWQPRNSVEERFHFFDNSLFGPLSSPTNQVPADSLYVWNPAVIPKIAMLKPSCSAATVANGSVRSTLASIESLSVN